jgi:hypothetical protein
VHVNAIDVQFLSTSFRSLASRIDAVRARSPPDVVFAQECEEGALMVFVYIILFVVVAAALGKLVNRRGDGAYRRTATFGSMTSFRFSRFGVDPEENTRPVDDGTEYGYKEFD